MSSALPAVDELARPPHLTQGMWHERGTSEAKGDPWQPMSADELQRWLQDGAAIYICGSLQGMAAGVDQALIDILGADALEMLIEQGRYRRDVY